MISPVIVPAPTTWRTVLYGMAAALTLSACTSNGIIVESVNNYGGNGDLANSIANGDGFLRGMLLVEDSPWRRLAHFTDGDVWDTDFVDREIDSRGDDHRYFDQPGAAISYFTGHGIGTHGCTMTSCTTTAACTSPASGGGRLPGTCRFSPFDTPRCCYMVDRALVTKSANDQFNGFVNYTGGPIRFGESGRAGGWAQAGTHGGTNLVVLDISHGVLPPYWRETLAQAFAGVHMIATLMTQAATRPTSHNAGRCSRPGGHKMTREAWHRRGSTQWPGYRPTSASHAAS